MLPPPAKDENTCPKNIFPTIPLEKYAVVAVDEYFREPKDVIEDESGCKYLENK